MLVFDLGCFKSVEVRFLRQIRLFWVNFWSDLIILTRILCLKHKSVTHYQGSLISSKGSYDVNLADGHSHKHVHRIPKNKKKQKNIINFATLNTRSLHSNSSILELEQAFSEKNIAVLGLAETRRTAEKIVELKSRNMLLHTAAWKGQRGVGFLVRKEWKENISNFNNISNRIAVFKLKMGKNKSLVIIQVHVPTLLAEEQEINTFY